MWALRFESAHVLVARGVEKVEDNVEEDGTDTDVEVALHNRAREEQ